jgi:ADP-heptose:LPS heptosyltransferase
MKEIKSDCKYFWGDKPCKYHKEEGVKCICCGHYDPMNKKILIIKLGAPGDVLRTTPILRALKRQDRTVHITWITEKASAPLLDNNPYIDRLWEYSTEIVARLYTEAFDLVLSLDNAGDCASFASLSNSGDKLGFGLNKKGGVGPFNKEAETWFEMAVFDDVKKANERTYQDHIFSICRLKFDPCVHEVILNLNGDEKKFGKKFALAHGIKDSDFVVGVNIGSGGRWPMKRWKDEGFVELIERLVKEDRVKIVLLGGPEEVERAEKIKNELQAKGIDIINGGCDNPLRDFIAIVDQCDAVVTGDTLALHIAVGLKKHVVAFFGPTSASEIELYGRGEKIIAAKDCVCCYKQQCNINPYCVETITVGEICDAVKRCLVTLAEKHYQKGRQLAEIS